MTKDVFGTPVCVGDYVICTMPYRNEFEVKRVVRVTPKAVFVLDTTTKNNVGGKALLAYRSDKMNETVEVKRTSFVRATAEQVEAGYKE